MDKEKGKEEHKESKIALWYNKNYKFILIIPMLMLVLSLVYLFSFYQKTGDIMNKDISLTGGASITVFTEKQIDIKAAEKVINDKFGDSVVRVLTDLGTGKQIAVSIEANAKIEELKPEIEKILGYTLSEDDYTAEFTGSSLSQSFYKELITALVLAFVLMAVVVFVIFRSPMPCIAVIFAAFTDITISLAVVNLLGVKISTAGIAAFLMLIGYSVDTDILLTTRLLKRHDHSSFERLIGAIKTGLTMTLTSLFAVFVAYFITISSVLKQVFLILSIGLFIDMIATWLGNAPMLKWYCDNKGIQ